MTDMPSSEPARTTITETIGQGAAEMQVFRQMAETMAGQTKLFGQMMETQTRAIEKMSDKLDDVSTRLIQIEAAKHERQIERLEALMSGMSSRIELSITTLAARVDALERLKDQGTGALGLVAWARNTVPWLFGIAAAAWGAYNVRPH